MGLGFYFGEFKNNKFTVRWNDILPWDGGSFFGSIEFQFDTASTPGYFKITDYFITETAIRPWDTSGTYVQKTEFSGKGKNIYGYYSESLSYAEFIITGNLVCENIDYVIDEQTYPNWWIKSKDTFCDNDSHFKIQFWKE